ncbi:MAG: hypothetical protein H6586_06805 [Flavobacteriales bacterium]|nr:hypothetical protein [Flavobacteriales bacterium]
MKKLNLTILFALILLLFSCEDKSKEKKVSEDNLKVSFKSNAPILLEGEELIGIANKIGSPDHLCLQDSFLIIADNKSEHPFHIININKNEYLQSAGVYGKGPGEVLAIFSARLDNKTIWAADFTLGKLIGFDVDSLTSFASISYSPLEEYNIVNSSGSIRQLTYLSDSLFIGINARGNMPYRFLKMDLSGNIVDSIAKTSFETDEKDISIQNQSHYGQFILHPNKNKILVAGYNSDFIEIYNIKGELLKLIKTQDNFNPIYEVNQIGDYLAMGVSKESRYGYTTAAATSDLIYAVYNGTMQEENIWGGHIIHVFDWQGNYIKTFKTDDLILQMIVDDKNEKIYAIVNQDLPTLKVYSIK